MFILMCVQQHCLEGSRFMQVLTNDTIFNKLCFRSSSLLNWSESNWSWIS